MRIRNWREFQHYKHRDPPWIKLHKRLLNDRQWHELDGDAAKILINLWMIASEADGELPSSADLAFRLRITEKQLNSTLSKLSHWVEQDASSTLAPCLQHADTETETETETETDIARYKKEEFEKEFLEFYLAYPKKVAKQDAARAYAAALRVVPHETIMAGLAQAIKSDSRFREAKFTPYPASWLRAGCYEDEGSTPQKIDPNRFKALPGSPEFLAWKTHFHDANKPVMIRELNQRELECRAFSFESQWPPGFVQAAE